MMSPVSMSDDAFRRELGDGLVLRWSTADDTERLVNARFPQVELIRPAANLGGAGRNVGLQRCDRPYVALCDDDTWWDAGSLRRAADVLEAHPRLAVVTAKVLVGERNRVDPTCLAMARSPLGPLQGLGHPALIGFLAGASVVRRAASSVRYCSTRSRAAPSSATE